MTRIIAGVFVLAASAFAAAPLQKYPGQPTEARVWIENRTKPEAVAVSVQDVAPDTVMNVTVHSMPAVRVAEIAGGVERKRQRWEYQTLHVRPGQDIAAELNRAGSDSWEVVGSQVQDSSGMLFVVKRPR